MRVMAVDAPGGEYALGEAIFARTTYVIHDLLTTILDDRFSDARCEFVEHLVPTHLHPFSFTSFACSLQRIEDAIRVVDLIECRRTLGAIASARTRMFRIPFKLLYLATGFIDVGK